jgi:hypothetical protein
MEDLRLAKKAEILEERGLQELAKQRRKEQEKVPLQEVLKLFKTDLPKRIDCLCRVSTRVISVCCGFTPKP